MFEDIQLENFEALLDKIENGPSSSTIHGFLSAVHCISSDLEIDKVFPLLFEQEEPVEKGEDRDELHTLVLELSKHIVEELKTEAYSPLLEVDDDENVVAESWAIGFYLGMDFVGSNFWDHILQLPEEDELFIDLNTIIIVANSALEGVVVADEQELVEACQEHLIEDLADIVLDLFEFNPKS
jgi:yecA family protein